MFCPRHPLLPHGHPERTEGPAFSFLKYEPPTACLLAVSPLAATLTRPLQLTDKAATLSPTFATLTSRVNPNPFVCYSYKKHRGVAPLHGRIDLSTPRPVFAVAGNPFTASPLFLPPAKSHHSRVTNFLEINTCKTHTKQTTLTTFRINTYAKPWGRAILEFACSRNGRVTHVTHTSAEAHRFTLAC